MIKERFNQLTLYYYYRILWLDEITATHTLRPITEYDSTNTNTHRGERKGKGKTDFAARTLTLNKQYLHSSHQIYNEKYWFMESFYKIRFEKSAFRKKLIFKHDSDLPSMTFWKISVFINIHKNCDKIRFWT